SLPLSAHFPDGWPDPVVLLIATKEPFETAQILLEVPFLLLLQFVFQNRENPFMRKLFIYIFGIVLFFGSCEDKKKPTETEIEIDPEVSGENKIDHEASGENEIDSEALEEIDAESLYPKITNENVVSFLTEYGKNNPETKVQISTPLGDIEIELYKDTPLHRANFIYLVKQGYFNETFFH